MAGFAAVADHWEGGHMGSGWAASWMALVLVLLVVAGVVVVLLARAAPRRAAIPASTVRAGPGTC